MLSTCPLIVSELSLQLPQLGADLVPHQQAAVREAALQHVCKEHDAAQGLLQLWWLQVAPLQRDCKEAELRLALDSREVGDVDGRILQVQVCMGAWQIATAQQMLALHGSFTSLSSSMR